MNAAEMWKAEYKAASLKLEIAQARIEVLTEALREGLRINSVRSDMKLQDQLDEFRRIANAALGGGKEAK